MRRRSRAGGEQVKKQHRKTIMLKRRNAPKAARRRSSTAGNETEVARLTRELHEAREQQTATGDVLKVISRSTFDLQTVLNTLVESAARLCDADSAVIYRPAEEGVYRHQATYGYSSEFIDYMQLHPLTPNRGSVLGRAVLEHRVVHVEDVLADPNYQLKEQRAIGGYRTALGVPLMREGTSIGVILLSRSVVKPFTDKQVELVTTFAAQAVIAIENTRLLNELSESLQQQTATADVLKVVSRSTFDLQTVLNTLIESAAKLCEADMGYIARPKGDDSFRHEANYGFSPALKEYLDRTPIRVGRGSAGGRALLERAAIHIPNARTDPDYELASPHIGGFHTLVGVPLMREGTPIGVLVLARRLMRPFTDRQIELLTTFADQAVIAIENVRLFEAEQQRTSELRESLEQQTATSKVLEVISSSPGDLKPVFEAILANAVRLCGAKFGNLYLREGDGFLAAAMHNAPPAYAEQRAGIVHPSPHSTSYRATQTKQPAQIADITKLQAYVEGDPWLISAVSLGGYRSALAVPMLHEDEPIGAITIFRQEAGAFADKQIELLTNFAKQAVIALENTRLLNELRESLQQQTATADVLKVISSSPGELEPVFDAMLANATRICEAKFGTLYLRDGEAYRAAAMCNTPPAFAEYLRRAPIHPGPGTGLDRITRTKQLVHLADITVEQAYIEGDPLFVTAVEAAGYRTVLVVPMLKDGQLIGAITIYRQEVRPFTDKQIGLVQNFAAQAVIAIENTRLLNELRQRTDDLSESLEQQTATTEVLRVISSTPGELAPVFDTMLSNATRLCEAKFGILMLCEGDAFHMGALHNVPAALADLLSRGPVRPGANISFARAAQTRQPVQYADVTKEQAYLERNPLAIAAVEFGNYRTILSVPMLKEGEPIGVITMFRQEVRPFGNKQIELVQNFAAQAVIAIENARLLNELRESLQQQTATADVFKVISRSTFDLQTVLDTLVESAGRLCAADRGAILMREGDGYRINANYRFAREGVQYASAHPLKPGRGSLTGRVALEGRPIHIPDVLTDPEYHATDYQQALWYRTALGVPLLREGTTIGVFALTRDEVNPFTEKQIELVMTFADQAVIAIENARLLSELRQSLEQQTATSEVLRVISSSPTNVQPVFDSIAESAVRLCSGQFSFVTRFDGKVINFASCFGLTAEGLDVFRSIFPLAPGDDTVSGRAILRRAIAEVADVVVDAAYGARAQRLARTVAYRSIVAVPLLHEGNPIGAIAVARAQAGSFPERQIALLQAFADQAVIAIRNVRLFDEVQARTEELSEALERQTATADVLKVISRSAFDLQTVLDTLVESAARLCGADSAAIHRPDGNSYPYVASYGYSREYHDYMRERPIIPGRGTILGRAVTERKPIQVNDVEADPEYTFQEGQRLGGFRTVLGIPLLREGVPIGVIVLTRNEVRPFTDKQIELATTFADQAAIAIENVRLFEAEQQRTEELARSLEELRTAQDRLVQTQKLASLGQLTAGIAHEIKNPLNFVNNFSGVSVELINELEGTLQAVTSDERTRSEFTELMETLRGNLDKIVQHGKRADSIVKNMLLHSREGSGEHRPVDINVVLEESLNLAYHGARAEKQGFNITLERSFDPAAGEVDLFPQEITRVFLNLISNGFYAATKRKNQIADGTYEPTLAAVTKNLGDRVEIRIRDNGAGILPEVKERMFNPFFTTKPAGEGTGLGLSISHDIIVKQHAGTIEVETRPGEFTEFRIVLPRTAALIAKTGGRA